DDLVERLAGLGREGRRPRRLPEAEQPVVAAQAAQVVEHVGQDGALLVWPPLQDALLHRLHHVAVELVAARDRVAERPDPAHALELAPERDATLVEDREPAALWEDAAVRH